MLAQTLRKALAMTRGEPLPTALNGATVMQGLLQSIEDEAGMGSPRYPPADNSPGKRVDDECHINEALPCRDVGEVRHHSRFGRNARNCRFTRSAGYGVALSGTVVLASLPRTTPRRPISPPPRMRSPRPSPSGFASAAGGVSATPKMTWRASPLNTLRGICGRPGSW